MTIEHTLSIIKPDAVGRNVIGGIYQMLEKNGFNIVAAKMMRLTKEQAGKFYAEHEGRHFFAHLIEFMTSGPVMVQVLKSEDAVTHYRKLMGATDPNQAEPGTIRDKFAVHNPESKVQKNAVHGSDSVETAQREINFFFKPEEIFSSEQC